jgi:hypothetical protein
LGEALEALVRFTAKGRYFISSHFKDRDEFVFKTVYLVVQELNLALEKTDFGVYVRMEGKVWRYLVRGCV